MIDRASWMVVVVENKVVVVEYKTMMGRWLGVRHQGVKLRV